MNCKIFGLLGMAGSLALATATYAATPAAQGANEKAFDSHISAADQMTWLKQMTSAPNHVGSAHDKANADFILAQFKAWGWDAKIEQFDVLYPTPVSTAVELVTPRAVKLGGQEPAIPEDATSGNTADALPPYVAFQGDGDVTADVVYVNYGMPADYQALERRGISVKDKIVLVRYGGGWRGLKPKLAQEHGAVGTIIFSLMVVLWFLSSWPGPPPGACDGLGAPGVTVGTGGTAISGLAFTISSSICSTLALRGVVSSME